MEKTQSKHEERRGFMAFLPAIVIFVLAAICVLLVGLYVLAPNSRISAMEVATQNVSGVTATNYMPILEENVDWEALSDDERATIARQAVKAAKDQAAKDGVTTFNVIGFTQQSVTIFLSTGGDTVYVYVGEETIPVSLEE
ncbi:MAG: hypothetical protein LBU48_00645 [Coriobacteriales bacterium]|jgi:hypothetical protein|nr:hypothetical protein [Coriobacteriales bacterium]